MALKAAAAKGDLVVVDQLLASKGIDVNGNYDACRWLGHEYINRKYTEDCDSDTSSLSDTALATVSEEAALRNAAGAGHAAIVTALLAAGADVNVSTKRYGYTPLLCACSQGHAHIP